MYNDKGCVSYEYGNLDIKRTCAINKVEAPSSKESDRGKRDKGKRQHFFTFTAEFSQFSGYLWEFALWRQRGITAVHQWKQKGETASRKV